MKQKNRTCLIHSDNTIAELDNYVGQTFVGYREYVDPGPVQLDKKLYHMEFSSEPVQEQLLSLEDQKNVLRCFRVQCEHGANDGNYNAYAALHSDLCESLIPDVDGGE